MHMVSSPISADQTPDLSILIPFYRDDCTQLLQALSHEISSLGQARVEVLVLDDQGGDRALSARTEACLATLDIQARLFQPDKNLGRAKGRNLLAHQARGQSLLFLDADMLPDTKDFVANWITLANTLPNTMIFGGFTLDRVPRTKDNEVHLALAAKSDCVRAKDRQREPEKNIFTSNLLVPKDGFLKTPFDETFQGWGWEDVEWGLRASSHLQVAHFDNTATHLGLDTVAELLAKYEQSTLNFKRLAQSHPSLVSTYPLYKVAKILQTLPFRAKLRNVLKCLALQEWALPPFRAFCLRLYRAALYAEVV